MTDNQQNEARMRLADMLRAFVRGCDRTKCLTDRVYDLVVNEMTYRSDEEREAFEEVALAADLYLAPDYAYTAEEVAFAFGVALTYLEDGG